MSKTVRCTKGWFLGALLLIPYFCSAMELCQRNPGVTEGNESAALRFKSLSTDVLLERLGQGNVTLGKELTRLGSYNSETIRDLCLAASGMYIFMDTLDKYVLEAISMPVVIVGIAGMVGYVLWKTNKTCQNILDVLNVGTEFSGPADQLPEAKKKLNSLPDDPATKQYRALLSAYADRVLDAQKQKTTV